MRKLVHLPDPLDPHHQRLGQDIAPDGQRDLPDAHPSKTRRKAEMHALQDLGEALVGLTPARLEALGLPERLADSVAEARHITKWEARRRQMQFIGRLMRDIDPLPIRAQLERWADAPNAEKARLANVERWRTSLLSDASALDRFFLEHASADRSALAALITRVHEERAHAQPPHAFRELFRVLNVLLTVA